MLMQHIQYLSFFYKYILFFILKIKMENMFFNAVMDLFIYTFNYVYVI
jgi:hypothetical protein